MYSIILCGGSGTRLWPLSRKNFPKQFLKIYSENSLVQETYLRVRALMPAENIFLVTDNENFFTAINQMRDIDSNFNESNILIEPNRLGTAPALAYAVKYLKEIINIDPSEQILALPSDHYIGNIQKYLKIIKTATISNGDHMGIIGIKPTAPKSGFGYILKGDKRGDYYLALEFKEKPDEATAQKYLDSGKYVWNSGMYIFNIKSFIRELNLYAPDLYAHTLKDFKKFIKDYDNILPSSFESDILEKSSNIIIFEGDFNWSDVGSFDALAEVTRKDANKRHILMDSKNIFVHSDSDRLVVTLGVSDLNIIETVDSILVQKKGRGEDIKLAIQEMKKRGIREIEHNLIVHRPWGKYEILIENATHRVKKTTLYPGEKLNIQSHVHRAEHWIVINGVAKIKIADKESILCENESAFVSKLVKHGIENYGKTNLEIIEVQTGEYLGEDDTITYDNEGNPADPALIYQK